jgi:hypothetical protein
MSKQQRRLRTTIGVQCGKLHYVGPETEWNRPTTPHQSNSGTKHIGELDKYKAEDDQILEKERLGIYRNQIRSSW